MNANQVETFQGVPELMGACPAVETVRAYVARASDTRDPALISAERGLDALAVCRAVHGGSDLTAYPFVPLDCRGQSAESVDRDLASMMPRRTIVLTSLDKLAAPLQLRLAQLLQDDVAGLRRAEARVMATVTGNIEDAIAEGKLARELCMRFPLQLEVPPLRRRSGDIPVLIGCVAAEAAAAGAATLREARQHFEREYIASVLSRHRGRMDEAARTLGLQRTNLYRKVRQLGIGRARAK